MGPAREHPDWYDLITRPGPPVRSASARAHVQARFPAPGRRGALSSTRERLRRAGLRPAPGAEGGAAAGAQRAAEMAYGELFGIDRRFLQFLTPAMLADRLGHPRVAQAFCELMAEEADLRKLQGDPVTASVLAQQALALLDEAHVPEEGLRLKLRDLRG